MKNKYFLKITEKIKNQGRFTTMLFLSLVITLGAADLAQAQCDVPTNRSSSNATASTIDLDWDDATGAESYVVFYRVLGASNWISADAATSNLTLSGLLAGTTYLWKVQSICAGSSSSFTVPAVQFKTTGVSNCRIPENKTEQSLTDQSVTLNWSDAAGAISYIIFYREVSSSTWIETTSVNSDKSLSGLMPETTYVWKARSVCDGSGTIVSKFSQGKPFTTLAPCATPVNLSSSNIMDNTVDLDWDDVSDVTNYRVQYRVQGSTVWNSVVVGTSNVTLTGLESGLVYQWRVRATCTGAVNSSNTAIEKFTTTGAPSCAAPGGLMSSNIMDNSADLSWTAETNAIGYLVQYRVLGASNWVNAAAATNNITITGLSPGLDYQWKVRTECSNTVVSVFSDPVTFTTTGTPTCFVPSNLAASNIMDTSADISWDMATGATSYVIEYKVLGAPEWIEMSPGTNSVSLTGLFSGQTYQYRVRSVCSSSVVSAFSDSEFFTTTGTPACAVPSNLGTGVITTISATLTWDAVAGATSYVVFFREVGQSVWNESTTAINTTSLAGLSPGTLYEWKVRSICSADNSLLSAFTAATTFSTTNPPSSGSSTITVFNMQGNQVASTLMSSDFQSAISELRLSQGLYILKISSNNETTTKRIAIGR